MKRLFLSLLVLVAVGLGSAAAETVRVPERNPLFSFDLPAGWSYERIDGGIELSSPDDEIFMSVEIAHSPEQAESIVKKIFEYLEEQGVTDIEKVRESTDSDNGIEFLTLAYTGRFENKPTDILIITGPAGRPRVAITLLWADEGAIAKHVRALQQMSESTLYAPR